MELEHKKYWLLLYGLIIGALFDIFFYNKTLGISYFIFIILILVILLVRFLGDIIKRIFVPFSFIHRPFLTLSRITDHSSKDSKTRILPKVIIGILISIPILAIILWLLSSADIVFKNFFINIPILKIFKNFVLIILIS